MDSADRWAHQSFKRFGIGLRGITAIDAEGNRYLLSRASSFPRTHIFTFLLRLPPQFFLEL